jgi:hypothetical protein
MPTKVLSIVETPYRATIEEQDDTVLWLTHMLHTGGLDMTVLLRANAVNYLVRDQDPSGVHIGDIRLQHPPQLDLDLEHLAQAGVNVLYVGEDAATRGIRTDRIVGAAKEVTRSELPRLFDEFDLVWHW